MFVTPCVAYVLHPSVEYMLCSTDKESEGSEESTEAKTKLKDLLDVSCVCQCNVIYNVGVDLHLPQLSLHLPQLSCRL